MVVATKKAKTKRERSPAQLANDAKMRQKAAERHLAKESDFTPEEKFVPVEELPVVLPPVNPKTVHLPSKLSSVAHRAIEFRCVDGVVATRVLNTLDGIQEAQDHGIIIYEKGMLDESGKTLVLNEEDFPVIPVRNDIDEVVAYRLKTGVDTILGVVSRVARDEFFKTEGGDLIRWNNEVHGVGKDETLTFETLQMQRKNLPANVRQVQLNKPPV